MIPMKIHWRYWLLDDNPDSIIPISLSEGMASIWPLNIS